MATPWPQEQTWPTHHREHATQLSRHLQTALKSIDTANEHPLDPKAVRLTLIATISLLAKLQKLPELGHLHQAIESLRAENKTAHESNIRESRTIRIAMQQNTAELKENTNTTRAASAAAKEAWKASELAVKVVKDIKALEPMNQGNTVQSYASVAARGGLAGSMHNPCNQRASQTQILREIIVNIRDPITIASIRAMNPRSLKAHVDRAIEQSSNEHIRKLKTVSANQLKSGDLSVKTATAKDMEALRQFAEDWENHIGNGAAVRIPTYGVLAHGIRTSSMNMDRFTEIRDDLLQDNKAKKTASSVVVELSRAEDANKLIDEGLIWQGQVFQCERYDRQCRLRQCFKCCAYGHIGTQCKATTTCGYCAQEHATRDCPSKSDTTTPRKCAACYGEHEAWHGGCPTRIREKAKIKAAYGLRSRYHPEQTAPQPVLGSETRTRPNPRIARPPLEPGQSQENRPSRSRSPTKKIQKRPNPTATQESEETITVAAENTRPRRTIIRSRRALEALDPNTQMTDTQTIILQYNVRKSKDTVMATLLRDPNIDNYDIIAIQEPWRNPYSATTHHPAKDRFHLCYPSSEENGPARVCFFINKKLDHSRWQFREVSRDLCTLAIATDDDAETSLVLHNVYNPSPREEDRQPVLQQLRTTLETHQHVEQIVVGDFNLHHELWGGSDIRAPDREATELLDLMDDMNLTSQLRTGTITYEEGDRRTTIDLCLVTRPRTKTALDRYVETSIDALSAAIKAAVPTSTLSPKSRRGWDEQCAAILAETKRLRRDHSERQTEESWEAYRTARNRKGRIIKKALQQAHREAVETAAESPRSLWKIAKWARNRQSQPPTVTPEIKKPNTSQVATTPEEKAALFKETFFPPPPEANLEDIDNASYNNPIGLPPVSESEVEDAIQEAAPLKAPGPDGITNLALQVARPWITPHLVRIFNQSLRLGYCPQHFRKSTTVVLRKPGKDNYTVPKAYRPIALLNTVGKIMDAIIARRLSYLAETHGLLPDSHMGGRRRRSTEHALHQIVDRIYEAWGSGQGMVASLLLLDVSGAFDNVSHRRLLHNLRKRRIDETTVRWVASFLGCRETEIHVDGFRSETYRLDTGIPQGSPLSPILYLFYNADLLDSCNETGDTTATGFIDDVAILAVGDSTEETCQKLQEALRKAETWALTHASVFAPEKFQLTHFTRAKTRIDTDKTLHSQWGEIKPKTTCKYLGLIMDSALKWKQHIDETERKVTNTVTALSSLGSSTWGVMTREMRTIYRGVAIPQMMYACSLWSNSGWGQMGYTKRTLNRLQRLQARAARAMCGAYRATSFPALDVEMHLLPVEQQIWKHNIDTISRVGMAEVTARRGKKISPRQTITNRIRDGQDVSNEQHEHEHIPPFITPPWWQGPRVHIAGGTEQAEKEHERCLENNTDAAHIYTDGSGIDGQIGAAAVCTTTQQTRKSHMGDDTTSTVYAGELQGIVLALEMAQADKENGNDRSKVFIHTDNQAAIRSSANPKGKSGAYLLKAIAEKTQALREQGLEVELRWVPAHIGIQGNEAADIAAKEATGWRPDGQTGPRADKPRALFKLRSTVKTWSHKETHHVWQTNWETETRGRTSFRLTPKPTKKVLGLHEGLSKRQSALLVQMRTEKIGLQDFLFNRRVPGITNANCPCREGRQTVSHILLRCRRFRQLRRQAFGTLPGRHNLRVILNKRKAAARAIRFIEQTEILGQHGIESHTRLS
ncbi:zinc knuckle [Colletotrichum abscissum]|uniref:Zinc knuckle n=2 Tax=Colletotrichum acutatum species complex TaxID=2707335 RepID=A0A9Q0B2B6_9PEZI|nr:zinc knuckle [Colletotrichum abscissum]